MNPPLQVKVVVVGNAGVGKTSIVTAFTDIQYEMQYIPTIGVDYKQKRILTDDGTPVKIQLWDTAGQERFRSLTLNYYRGADVILLVFDISNKKSFTALTEWKQIVEGQQPDSKYVVVGNKLDREIHREVTKEEGETWAKIIHAEYFEISAKQNRLQTMSGGSASPASYITCGAGQLIDPMFKQIAELALKNSLSTAKPISFPLLKLKSEPSFFSKYC